MHASLNCLVLGVCLVSLQAAEAPRIELRVPAEPRRVHVERLGINLNYLEDGAMLDPADGIPLVEGLRQLGVRSLRYPGGSKSDSHLWSVPPFDRPAPRLAVTGEWDWPAMSERHWDRAADRFALPVLDTDQALALARRLDAELVLVVAYDQLVAEPDEEAGRYDNSLTIEPLIETAVAWVRYCRAQGRPVRYWEIGNETYLHQGIGAERYAADLIRFATALKAEDPTIRIGANGPERTGTRGKADELAGRDTPWWPTVLAAASAHIDYLSLHDYPCWEWRSFAAYATRRPDVLTQLRQLRRAIDRHAAPADRDRIELVVTETSSADWKKPDGWPHEGSIGHALVLFDMLAQYLGHDDLVTVQVWNTRWVRWREQDQLWDALGDDNRPSTIGRALALWSQAQSHWLAVDQVEGVLCVPTWDPVSGALTVFLVNRTIEPRAVVLTGQPIAAAAEPSVRSWAGVGPDDLDPVFGERVPADPSALTVPAAGMLILEFGPLR